MNIVLVLIFLLSSVSFSYRYISWFFVPQEAYRRLSKYIWGLGTSASLWTVANFFFCGANVWLSVLFVVSLAIATAHDAYNAPVIGKELFTPRASDAKHLTTSICIQLVITALVAFVGRTRDVCRIVNATGLVAAVVTVVPLLSLWRRLTLQSSTAV